MEIIYNLIFLFILIHTYISAVSTQEESYDSCAAQWVPPDPATGCCGKDLSGVYAVDDLENLLTTNNLNREKRSSNDSASFEIEGMVSRRITGGTDTKLDQFPWVVYIETYFEEKLRTCTGALISDLYILTAAHCVHEYGLNVLGIKVRLAEYDLKYFPIDCKYDSRGNQQCVENILMYPVDSTYNSQHDSRFLFNDIGIIKLRSYAPYTRFVRPICLPTFDIDRPDFANLPLQVAGWGKINPYDEGDGLKLSAVVGLVPNDECEKFYNYNFLRSQLCAVGKAGQDPCPGDSGGPLMLLYGGTYYLVGIVSGKRRDTYCGSSVPATYMNIFQFLPWIKEQLGY